MPTQLLEGYFITLFFYRILLTVLFDFRYSDYFGSDFGFDFEFEIGVGSDYCCFDLIFIIISLSNMNDCLLEVEWILLEMLMNLQIEN